MLSIREAILCLVLAQMRTQLMSAVPPLLQHKRTCRWGRRAAMRPALRQSPEAMWPRMIDVFVRGSCGFALLMFCRVTRD